jgi:hypothetical protein
MLLKHYGPATCGTDWQSYVLKKENTVSGMQYKSLNLQPPSPPSRMPYSGLTQIIYLSE